MQQIAASPRVGRGAWPRRGQRRFTSDDEGEERAFLLALARELELAPIDLVDAGRVRSETPEPRVVDDSADRAAFHSQLMPPGFSVRSFAGGYAPGALFSLVG